jgi:two-component system chemotaxis sensor kinase CheA
VSDIQAQLLAAFDVEQREHLAAIRAALARAGGGAPVELSDAFRRAHSLKGAARAVGLAGVEEIAHRLETMLAGGLAGPIVVDAATHGTLTETLDALEGEVAAATGPALPAVAAEPGEASPSPEAAATEYLRVAAPHVDGLGDAVRDLLGEVQARAVLEERLAALDTEFGGLSRSLAGFRRRGGVAPKAGRGDELAAFERAFSGFGRRLAALRRVKRQADWSLERAARRVRDGAAAVSLVAAGDIFGGFGRAVRDLARSEGREVEMRFAGAEVEAARDVLQGLKDPVLHVLRNAVGHGIEPPEARAAAGKPALGAIVLDCAIRGDRLVVTVSDDGHGPDLERIAAVADARGLLPAGAKPNADELLQLVFAPGFSTAAAVDRLSGRGVGLAVVAAAVQRLRGHVVLRRGEPAGTVVEMSVPLSSALQSVLLVEAEGETFGLPSAGVERLLRFPAEAIEGIGGGLAIRVAHGGSTAAVPLVPLARLTGSSNAPVPVEAGHVKAALIRAGDRRVAVAVNALLDARSMTVASVEAFGADRRIVSGAVIHKDGPVPVLDPAGLVERARLQGGAAPGLADWRPPVPDAPTTILVVDDSITTRTLEKSILEAQGYRVLLSVDGLDALETLRAGTVVDLVVADVEMPRMDGFGLLQALKNDPRFAALPVVMMTSRADPDDIQRGLDLGADAYIAKQKFDQRDLLATIGQLL